MRSHAFLILTLSAALVAGCTSAPLADLESTRTVTADDNLRISPGYAYDGSGVERAEGTLQGSFTADEDTGHAVMDFNVGPDHWVITFDQFAQAPGADFMDGGIVFDLWEHGDTGVSSPSIPKILATVAAWGTATVTVNGAAVAAPNTGEDRWAAHLMVSDTTIRFDDGRMTKEDGETPYDPDDPGNARTEDENRQVIFSLSPGAADGPAFSDTRENTVRGEGSTTVSAPAVYGGLGRVSVDVQGVGGAAGAGSVDVSVASPSGDVVATESVGPLVAGAQEANVTLEWEAVETGHYEVIVRGEGAVAYVVDVEVTQPPARALTLTWDDFEIS